MGGTGSPRRIAASSCSQRLRIWGFTGRKEASKSFGRPTEPRMSAIGTFVSPRYDCPSSRAARRTSSKESRGLVSPRSTDPASRRNAWIRAVSKSARALSCFIVSRRSEEHTSELQSQSNLVCRLLLEKKKKKRQQHYNILSIRM